MFWVRYFALSLIIISFSGCVSSVQEKQNKQPIINAKWNGIDALPCNNDVANMTPRPLATVIGNNKSIILYPSYTNKISTLDENEVALIVTSPQMRRYHALLRQEINQITTTPNKTYCVYDNDKVLTALGLPSNTIEAQRITLTETADVANTARAVIGR